MTDKTKSAKHDLITEILANDVYLPDSLLYRRVYGQLMTLSRDVLSSLWIVLDAKTSTTKVEDQ